MRTTLVMEENVGHKLLILQLLASFLLLYNNYYILIIDCRIHTSYLELISSLSHYVMIDLKNFHCYLTYRLARHLGLFQDLKFKNVNNSGTYAYLGLLFYFI